MSATFPFLGALRLHDKAADLNALTLEMSMVAAPSVPPGQALVRVHSAGVNPSDVKAALGVMPHARFPRTPGRDFAGTVVAGPSAWVGRAVWGSGGDLGITRDGTHAGWLLLPQAALRDKPEALNFDQAGAVGVPFVTAYEGLRRAGQVQPGHVVAVMGANGRVGQAAVQLAAMAGATVIAVQRQSGPFAGHACAPVHSVDSRSSDVAARIRELSNGHGADIVFNTVGSVYFAAANAAMAKGATQIFIATTERAIPFDIFGFYRGMHSFVGIDTLALDCVASNDRLHAMKAGFEAGQLRAFPVAASGCFLLDDAKSAYRRVIEGASERIVLRP